MKSARSDIFNSWENLGDRDGSGEYLPRFFGSVVEMVPYLRSSCFASRNFFQIYPNRLDQGRAPIRSILSGRFDSGIKPQATQIDSAPRQLPNPSLFINSPKFSIKHGGSKF